MGGEAIMKLKNVKLQNPKNCLGCPCLETGTIFCKLYNIVLEEDPEALGIFYKRPKRCIKENGK
jgi:hypothetical protein